MPGFLNGRNQLYGTGASHRLHATMHGNTRRGVYRMFMRVNQTYKRVGGWGEPVILAQGPGYQACWGGECEEPLKEARVMHQP